MRLIYCLNLVFELNPSQGHRQLHLQTLHLPHQHLVDKVSLHLNTPYIRHLDFNHICIARHGTAYNSESIGLAFFLVWIYTTTTYDTHIDIGYIGK